MFIKFHSPLFKDEIWIKVLTLGSVLLFIFLADAVLSFWVPNFIESTFNSALVMGLVMSFSSVVGLVSDLYFPQLIRGITVKKLIALGVLASFIFTLLLLQSTILPAVSILLIAMAAWGIYYELIGFGEQQFMADSTPFRVHAAAWGILSVFRSTAYFLGPILAGLLLARGDQTPLYFALFLTGIGFVVLLLTQRKHTRPIQIETHSVSLFREISHWRVLFIHVWPIVVLSIFMGLIDATFWTTGAVWTETLSEKSFWGGLFLPIYTLPSLFMGFVVAKMGIYKGKKRLAEKFLMASGACLALLGITDFIFLQLIIVFCSSMMLSVSFPLSDAVYSDIVARMGRERRHLIGLSRSTISLAYIIGPASSGFIASLVGERMTFSIVGIIVVVVSFILLMTTPHKLKLPREEIKSWE